MGDKAEFNKHKALLPAAQLLYDTFSAFGMIIQTPKIMRDPETGGSKGFGFVSYDSFEASDAAIESMNGQFLCNRRALSHVPQGCVHLCMDDPLLPLSITHQKCVKRAGSTVSVASLH